MSEISPRKRREKKKKKKDFLINSAWIPVSFDIIMYAEGIGVWQREIGCVGWYW